MIVGSVLGAIFIVLLVGIVGGSLRTARQIHETIRGYERALLPLPPRWHWSRWRLTGWTARQLYVWGVTSTGGSILMCTGDGPFYGLPRWRDVLPYRLRWDLRRAGVLYRGAMRPYFLRLPNWWWQCHRRQGWRLWRHHRPYKPAAFGICGRCCPCWWCGAPDLWCECYREDHP